MKLLLAALLLLSLSFAASPAHSQQAENVVIYQSQQLVAGSTKEQHFEDNLTLKPGQEKQPLSLVIFNGGVGKVPFNWFRININGLLVASEKDMNGRAEAAVDLTNRLQPGGGQIIVDAAGEPRATLSFSLRTTPVVLTSIHPTQAQPGQHLVLVGSNFSSDENQNSVLINNQPAPILSAGQSSITAVVPQLASGTYPVRVMVNSMESRPINLTVSTSPQPVLTSINYWIAPPGAQLIITGQNFSSTAADNKVYFKTVAAQVVSASATELTVIVPNWSFGPQQLNIPLFVVTNGVKSSNALRFDFGAKYQGAWPTMPGDSHSESSL